MPSGLIPGHKQSIVLFLERVYGIETQELFFKILEEAFLPDLRAATMLDRVILIYFISFLIVINYIISSFSHLTLLFFQNDGSESDMALSMNRYIGNSILPLLITHSRFYYEAENYASLLDATLHTVYRYLLKTLSLIIHLKIKLFFKYVFYFFFLLYRLSKNRMLTKGQREAVSDFLVALTSQMQPSMLLKLLRKLTIDVSKLSEYTTVALRVYFQ